MWNGLHSVAYSQGMHGSMSPRCSCKLAFVSGCWGLCLWTPPTGDFRPPNPLFCPPVVNSWLRPVNTAQIRNVAFSTRRRLRNLRKHVRKVLWTRKAPACLLSLLYAYVKPRLCINIHHIRSTAHRAAAGRSGARCATRTAPAVYCPALRAFS